MTLEVLSGRLTAPDFERNPDDWLSVTWQPPAMPSVDPEKEVSADVASVNAGFASRASVIRARGADPEVVDAEVAADRDRARDLGLAFPNPIATGGARPAASNTNREAADA